MRVDVPAALTLALLVGCGGEGEPPRSDIFDRDASASTGGTGGVGLIEAGSFERPPPADATDLCGNLVVQVAERINLYWVLDRSGSMGGTLEGTAFSKYVGARSAIAQVMRKIGHRVSVGAAVFPVPENQDPACATGGEVFETRPGDSAEYGLNGADGPVLQSLLGVLAGLTAAGGTPIASTLVEVTPDILGLEGTTAVILATDGAPNCNFDATCDESMCLANIEGTCFLSGNCCDPSVPNGPAGCFDAEPTKAAVRALADAGVETYVVGMPGSELYAAFLDELAEVGGTARDGSPKYYAATGADDLTATLEEVGTTIAIHCTVELEVPPVDPTLVNVYFDTRLIPQDEVDGWAWAGPKTIELRGRACEDLKSGRYAQVQVAAGCPTHVR